MKLFVSIIFVTWVYKGLFKKELLVELLPTSYCIGGVVTNTVIVLVGI